MNGFVGVHQRGNGVAAFICGGAILGPQAHVLVVGTFVELM